MAADWEPFEDTFPSAAALRAPNDGDGELLSVAHPEHHGALGGAVNALIKDFKAAKLSYNDMEEAIGALTNQSVVNPTSKKWGAVGNDVVRDSAAFLNATTYLVASGGGTLLVPDGTFHLTSYAAKAGVNVVGMGPRATVLRCVNTGGLGTGFFDLKGTYHPTDSAGHVRRMSVRGLRIENGANPGSPSPYLGYGINIEHASSIRLDDVEVWDFLVNLRGYGGWDLTINDFRFMQGGARDASNVPAMLIQSTWDDALGGEVSCNNWRFTGEFCGESNFGPDIVITGGQRIVAGNPVSTHHAYNITMPNGWKLESVFAKGTNPRVLVDFAQMVTLDRGVLAWNGDSTNGDCVGVRVYRSEDVSVRRNGFFTTAGAPDSPIKTYIEVENTAGCDVEDNKWWTGDTARAVEHIKWIGSSNHKVADEGNVVVWNGGGNAAFDVLKVTGAPTSRRKSYVRSDGSVAMTAPLILSDGQRAASIADVAEPTTTISGATHTLLPANNLSTLLFTAAGGCAVSFTDSGSFAVGHRQVIRRAVGAGAVTISVGGTFVLTSSADLRPGMDAVLTKIAASRWVVTDTAGNPINVRNLTASSNVFEYDGRINADPTGGSITLTITGNAPQRLIVKRLDATDSMNTVTIACSGYTIDGATSYVLTDPEQTITLRRTGTSTFIVESEGQQPLQPHGDSVHTGPSRVSVWRGAAAPVDATGRTATTTGSSVNVTVTGAALAANVWNNHLLAVVSGPNAGQMRRIVSHGTASPVALVVDTAINLSGATVHIVSGTAPTETGQSKNVVVHPGTGLSVATMDDNTNDRLHVYLLATGASTLPHSHIPGSVEGQVSYGDLSGVPATFPPEPHAANDPNVHSSGMPTTCYHLNAGASSGVGKTITGSGDFEWNGTGSDRFQALVDLTFARRLQFYCRVSAIATAGSMAGSKIFLQASAFEGSPWVPVIDLTSARIESSPITGVGVYTSPIRVLHDSMRDLGRCRMRIATYGNTYATGGLTATWEHTAFNVLVDVL